MLQQFFSPLKLGLAALASSSYGVRSTPVLIIRGPSWERRCPSFLSWVFSTVAYRAFIKYSRQRTVCRQPRADYKSTVGSAAPWPHDPAPLRCEVNARQEVPILHCIKRHAPPPIATAFKRPPSSAPSFPLIPSCARASMKLREKRGVNNHGVSEQK